MEIRRSYDRLISTMGFPLLVRWHLYIESGPRCHCVHVMSMPALWNWSRECHLGQFPLLNQFRGVAFPLWERKLNVMSQCYGIYKKETLMSCCKLSELMKKYPNVLFLLISEKETMIYCFGLLNLMERNLNMGLFLNLWEGNCDCNCLFFFHVPLVG